MTPTERNSLLPIHIIAEHLDDAWWQTLRKCFQFGYEYEVTHGSYVGQKRYEFDMVEIYIKEPWKAIVPIVPEGGPIPPPASKEQVETYFANYLMLDEKSEREDYRYGERLVNPKLRLITRKDLSKPHEKASYIYEGFGDLPETGLRRIQIDGPIPMYANQVDEVIRMFKEAGHGTNQATMEIAMPNDILLLDPPCLRFIDCRIRYGKLHFMVYFRSWDLYAGFPVNLGGLELLKQYMVDRLKEESVQVENGSMIAMSKGLHIYSQYYELVESQLQVSLEKLRTKKSL